MSDIYKKAKAAYAEGFEDSCTCYATMTASQAWVSSETRSALLKEGGATKTAAVAPAPASTVITADDLKVAFTEGFNNFDTFANKTRVGPDDAWIESRARKVAEAKDLKLFVIQGNDYPAKIVRGTEAQVTALVEKLNAEEKARVEKAGPRGWGPARIRWRHYEFAVEDLR